jgi:accessory gene regulator protein AgrB
MDRREVRITRLNMGTTALFVGLFAAVMGLGISIAAWILSSGGSTSVVYAVLRGLTFGFHPGLGALILSVIYYFIGGVVAGYVSAAAFNLVASWMGGVELASRDFAEAATPMPSVSRSRRAEPTFGETIDNRRVDR